MAYRTRSKCSLSNSKGLITSFFSNNKAAVKLIQNHKKQLDPSSHTITTDHLIQLLIQLIEIYLGNDQEVVEEEIIELLQNYTSLKDLITRCLSESM